MNRISISNKIHKLLPNCQLGIIRCKIEVHPPTKDLEALIALSSAKLKDGLLQQRETDFPIIRETREAYKICGKEPSRYRPSSEALLRRLRTGRDLYSLNNIVDTINYLSMTSHFSIGGFDRSLIEGEISCDVGTSETYQAVGRGILNIEFMPGMRDVKGFFGTPTSDSERTMIRDHTKELLLVYYNFQGNGALNEALRMATGILKTHCSGKEISSDIIGN